MRMFRVSAVVLGIVSPFFWTTKAYFLRLTIRQRWFAPWDIGIDHLIFQALMQTLIYVAYLSSHEFLWNEFLEGQIVGVCFMLGAFFTAMAYRSGPGGPITALIMTQSIY